MCSEIHPWENIFKNDGWPFYEPFPRFGEIIQIFRDNGCCHILDLGCGNGRHIVHLEKEGFRTVGVDISPTGLQLTQQRLVSEKLKTELVLADIRFPLPFRNNSFDGLLSTQVIHHARVAQVRLAIHEIWRIISSDGLTFVTVSGKMDEDEEYEEIEPNTFVPLSGDEKGLPHHIFNVNEVREAFRAFILEDVSVRAEGHVIAILARKP